jgi:hypothetical protein
LTEPSQILVLILNQELVFFDSGLAVVQPELAIEPPSSEPSVAVHSTPEQSDKYDLNAQCHNIRCNFAAFVSMPL